MPSDPRPFFEAVISAGAILAGFCGTFLAFRIQREANYYRQPALDYAEEKARDVYIGLTHFSSAFFLVSIATICSMIFGFLIPLFAIAGSKWALAQTKLVVSGLTASLILLLGYFVVELVHYDILSSDFIKDVLEQKRENWIMLGVVVLIIIGLVLVNAVL